MRLMWKRGASIAVSVFVALSAQGHQAGGAYDGTQTLRIEGTVEAWRFANPHSSLFYDRVRQGAAAGRTVNDVIGDGRTPGMPIIMTRVWSFHVIPLKTAIVIAFNFEN